MALIYNDEVEEVRQKQLTEMLPIIVTHQLLIQGEIHLVGGDGIPVVLRHIDLVDDLFQRGKILPNRLIHQNVSVGQVENFSLHAAFQQAVHDLKSGICLPVPVAITKRIRCCPLTMASTVRLMALR